MVTTDYGNSSAELTIVVPLTTKGGLREFLRDRAEAHHDVRGHIGGNWGVLLYRPYKEVPDVT